MLNKYDLYNIVDDCVIKPVPMSHPYAYYQKVVFSIANLNACDIVARAG